MPSLLLQKYTELKAAAAVATDVDAVNELMVDILQLLHQQFTETSGSQKAVYERAYSFLNCTVSAHYSTRQDTSNQYYLSEMGQ
ncbi:hypothetical protein WBJ53_22940 [Spirosoma sp. SC4-14]|uniref:hypothetical protein n=1 Tax=Spirosoma sp. SC4-14 TaxID=3128900 RepID=UPI0030D4ACB2